jgi:hypothetical protein
VQLKPRDLIIDNWGREAIVVERIPKPTSSWLADQTDSRMREVPFDTTWWKVLGIRGGAGAVAEPLAKFVREATIEDAMRAIEYANEAAMRTIASLFPEAVKRALQERQKRNRAP